MKVWVKPSGVEVKLNDRPENEAQARKLGWKPKSEADKPRRSRKESE